MIPIFTFLTVLYYRVDEFCKTLPPEPSRPGEAPALNRSEVVTLAIFGQWARFRSERDFYRFAEQCLRPLFPTLPNRSQFNRLQRQCEPVIVAFFLHLADHLAEPQRAYEALDCTGVVTRNLKRRGLGWLPGQANIGWSNRIGWYEGFHLMVAATPSGVLTGYGFGPASAKDQPLAESFFALRQTPQPGFESVGRPSPAPYAGDRGFEGPHWKLHCQQAWNAQLVAPPKRNAPDAWPPPLSRWLAGLRQIVETVFEKLHHPFRLETERPHSLEGFRARLAAKLALHNVCIWINEEMGRPRLAFADLLSWS
jgi:hypothetical protein